MLQLPVLELSRRTMVPLHSQTDQKYRYLMLLLWKTSIVGADEIFLSKCCLSPVEVWKGRFIFNFFSRFKWNVTFSLWMCHNVCCSDILNDISFFIRPLDWGSETVKSFQSQGKILDKVRCLRHQGCFARVSGMATLTWVPVTFYQVKTISWQGYKSCLIVSIWMALLLLKMHIPRNLMPQIHPKSCWILFVGRG